MNKFRRERVFNLIGLGLLAICFVISLGRIVGRAVRTDDQDGMTTIHFAHWQLESGLRDAYDRLAEEYMHSHPNVRVVQMAIPETVYPNWLRTQLIGGTAPELIEIGGHGETNELLANYFVPLTSYLEKPNPYNAGTDLAQTSWRETFIDGMSHAYNQELLQYYSVPSSMFTLRMFYNRALWRQVFGREEIPRTYEEMLADCERIAAYRTPAGEPLLPIAGSAYNAPFVVQRLFSSQTQRLFFSLALPGQLYPTNEDLAYEFLAGHWNFQTPAVQDGLQLARGVGQYFPPGFVQLRRDDALFIFSQGRALMTVTGSWDAPSIRSQAPFEVGVFDIPVPTTNNPRYGKNTVGITSEAGAATGLSFGLTHQSSPAQQAQVLDFLEFLTCRHSNAEFSQYSGWLPGVVGIDPAPEVRPFLPRMTGYPPGFSMGIASGDAGGYLGTDTQQTIDTNMYRLFDSDGGPEAYVAAIAERIRPAVIKDLNTMHRNQFEVVTRQDTTLGACRALARRDGGEWRDKVSELDELQTQEEMAMAVRQLRLSTLGIPLDR